MAVALFLASSGAIAQSSPDPERLIRDGVALRKQGEDAKAHGYFQRAHDLAGTPRTAAQLGLCDLAVGRWLDADVHLTEALDSADPWVDNQRSALEQGRSKARVKLGKIAISGAAPGALVTATGRPTAKLAADAVVWVAPGAIHVRVEAPGYRSVEQDVTVAEGARATVELQMPPVHKDQPPPSEAAPRVTNELVSPDDASPNPQLSPRNNPRPRHDASTWRTPVVWTAAGLGAAMLGFGIYETLEYNSRIDAFNDPKRIPLCGDTNGRIAGGIDCERLAKEGDRAKVLTVVGYVSAGVLGLTALIVGLTGESSADNDVASSTMSCSPAQGDGMQAGVRCALRF